MFSCDTLQQVFSFDTLLWQNAWYLATSSRLESMKYFPKMLDMDKKQFKFILTVLVKYNPLCDSQFRKNE